MARTTAHVPRSAATGARVARSRSESASEPTGPQHEAQAEILRDAAHALAQARELTEGRPADSDALRYLESSRLLPEASPASLSPADQVKLAHTQADQIVHVILAVLDGLGLSHEDWERGLDIAMRALRGSTEDDWSPL